MASWRVFTNSPRQTMSWGGRLGKLFHGGEIVGLIGELGTGKSCFVRGVAESLEVGEKSWIRSPTFTLINEYQGRLPVYHIDLYRVGGSRQLENLDLRDYLYSNGVSLIEWFEHLPREEVDEYLELRLGHAGGNRRELIFIPHGEQYERITAQLSARKSSG
jgi:tRNA threonylcarbamoyladenosine biosynthesis protein TsaE